MSEDVMVLVMAVLMLALVYLIFGIAAIMPEPPMYP
jgi:hypothetical protein